ncbi:MAG: hypothetical protein M5U34_39285 [Chloroflexi bacterium]|nr:hypothetical protein [Chloroflexota bacterium]
MRYRVQPGDTLSSLAVRTNRLYFCYHAGQLYGKSGVNGRALYFSVPLSVHAAFAHQPAAADGALDGDAYLRLAHRFCHHNGLAFANCHGYLYRHSHFHGYSGYSHCDRHTATPGVTLTPTATPGVSLTPTVATATATPGATATTAPTATLAPLLPQFLHGHNCPYEHATSNGRTSQRHAVVTVTLCIRLFHFFYPTQSICNLRWLIAHSRKYGLLTKEPNGFNS